MKPSQSGGEIYPLTSRGMPSRKIRGADEGRLAGSRRRLHGHPLIGLRLESCPRGDARQNASFDEIHGENEMIRGCR